MLKNTNLVFKEAGMSPIFTGCMTISGSINYSKFNHFNTSLIIAKLIYTLIDKYSKSDNLWKLL